MWLTRIARALNRAISPVSRVANGVGAVFLAAMMFLTVTDVSLRYFFNRPLMGAFELTQFMMVILVSFGIAYCALLKGHVSVDLVVSRLRPRARAIIGSITYFMSLGIFSLVTWQSVLQANTQTASGQTSAILYIPIFPFVWVLAFGSGLLCLVLLVNLLESLSETVEKWTRLP